MEIIERGIDKSLTIIPNYETREYIQAPIDFAIDLFLILQNDPVTWVFEIITVLSFTVVPFIEIILVGFIG